ncbi:MAG TPA: M36 family metallopeptidase, partial [Pyrinomonadaceae bacterium]|nr:M36 family metallopeptidase [Pyrinomonadaceae bacterium]
MRQRPPTPDTRRSPILRKVLLSLTLPLVLFSLVWNFSPPAATQSGGDAPADAPSGGPENYDIRGSSSKAAQVRKEHHQRRSGDERQARKANRGARMRAAQARLADASPGLYVKANDYFDAPEIVRPGRARRRPSARAGEGHDQFVRGFIAANEDLYGLSARQVARLSKRAEYTNPAGNLSWVALEQSFNGIPVFQGELTAALTPDGELVQTTGTLAPDVNEKELETAPGISPQAAVAAAAASVGVTFDPASLVLKESDGGKSFVFTGGPFAGETKVELVYFPLDSGLLSLAWSTSLVQEHSGFYMLVDAEDGSLFFRKNAVNDQTTPATYVVYGSDSPAPLSPNMNLLSAAVPVDQGAAVGRDTFTLISQHPLGDPWLPDGVTTTTGNNVDSGLDLVSPDGIDAGSRAVSATRNFNFAYDPAPGFLLPPGESPTLANYRFGEVVNMFYWTNRFHDITYGLGFTEAARNFQQNNFGRGGAQNDRVNAQGQDFSGTSNANFLTLPDGQPGRMQMYIFNGPTPDRSSGLDQEIIIHELTHGLSNRLHGNASGLNFAQGGGMGEGWGDFMARTMLSDAGEDINGLYAAGGYSTLTITAPTAYNSNYYYGIRRFPYALRTTLGANGRPHNPLTFADVDASKINLTDG